MQVTAAKDKEKQAALLLQRSHVMLRVCQ